MPFFNDRIHMRTGYNTTKDRCEFTTHLSDEQIIMVDRKTANSIACNTRIDLIGGAVLWFESLDKGVQISKAEAFNAHKLSRKSFKAHAASRASVDKWFFPIYPRGRVLSAAILAFCDLESKDVDLWVGAFHRLVCEVNTAMEAA